MTGNETEPGAEALVGGRLIAWTGGAALVLALALLAGMAFSNGWFGPLARTGLAAVLSTGLMLAALRIRHAAAVRIGRPRGRNRAAPPRDPPRRFRPAGRGARVGAVCAENGGGDAAERQ
ncbi:DUF2339 domain-containing protein [Conexibacter sp. CPCC 206217]|uniref:DUF2339 domain-containing protein n=1 Tax=Conexibacter sp. CPCC 206217 TaxID=3064574 RepID=UPI002728419B|nr:DUF2339 domain-containing protein [Conexibacter sp. CPCC 206217]MDO8214188.1 DUF2339 domain-containing protein [Conexibacter sp. CPCC 206217]